MNLLIMIGLVIGSMIMMVIILAIVAYIIVKEVIPRMAERDILFTTVKKGRIKALMIGGRIIEYVGNISDQNRWVDPKTGKVHEGKEPVQDEEDVWFKKLLWEKSGVVWLGLNGGIFKYFFNGQEASSIYLDNSFELVIDGLESKVRAQKTDIKVQLVLETLDAGRWSNLKDPFSVLKNEILEAIRGWAASNTADEMFAQKTASKEGKEDLYQEVMGLNIHSPNNPSLEKTVGQRIVNFSMTGVDWSADIKAAMESEEIANKKRLADLQEVKKKAEEIEMISAAELKASENKAKGIIEIGRANNDALKGMKSVLGKEGATKVAGNQVLAGAIAGFGGKALSLGGNGIPIILSEDSAEASKKAKATSKK